MLGVIFVFVSLLGLLIFMIWDRRRIEKSVVKVDVSRGWRPSEAARWQGLAGVAVLAVIYAVVQFVRPSQPPFSGRWSWLNSAAHAVLGHYGVAWLAALVALGFAIAARAEWQRRR